MTDLISREAAIARIKQEMLERNTPFTEQEVGFWRGMLFCAEALTNMPSAEQWFPLSVDDAETELFFCLKNMIGNPTDDKALLAQMRERGLWVFARNGWSPEE